MGADLFAFLASVAGRSLTVELLDDAGVSLLARLRRSARLLALDRMGVSAV